MARLLPVRVRGENAPRTGQGAAAGARPGSLLAAAGMALVLCAIFSNPSLAATPVNGDRIVNTATLSTAEASARAASVTVTVATRTRSTIEFMKYAPGIAGATSLTVPATSYNNGSTGLFTNVPQPKTVGSQTLIDLTNPVPLLPYSTFHEGEPFFIRVIDRDQNLDRSRAETIIITVSDSKTGDSETLQLVETGPDSGVFIGYLQTTAASSIPNNGMLSVVAASSINARYTDIVDQSDSSADAALVDPFGIVFDTSTGKPVDGAKVELLNADSTAATVLGDNGLASNTYPNAVLSGGIATDSEGNSYSFTPGGYRFPFVAPGNYLLRITPPATYVAPSTVSTSQIQNLPGAPFTILEPGSRGEVFQVSAGPAIRVDIPLDPKIGTLWLRKSAGKSIVSSGDYLSYEVTLENSDPGGTVYAAIVTDKLPLGFRYQKGSGRLNSTTAVEPTISADGSTLTFTLGNIGPKSSVIIRYVAAVGAGAKIGTAVNIATATTTPAISTNLASASVTVQEPFMLSRNILMGRVFVGACSDNIEESKKGVEGVGIFLEDGTFVVSDTRGMFHFEGVRSGTHVVQLDLDSIPEGYKVLPCEQNSRFAGRAYSQFVDLQGGTMWRTDFHLGRPELPPPAATNLTENSLAIGRSSALQEQPLAATVVPGQAAIYKGEIALEMISSQNDEIIDYRLPLQANTVPLRSLRLSVILPPGATYQPGSSSFDGAALPDPEVTADRLIYSLEDATEKWRRELQFRATVDKSRNAGELETKAVLKFDTSIASNILTPEVTNILALTKEDRILPLPLFVFRPHFPTFGDELSASDRQELDGLVSNLSGKIIKRIDVTGHTDNVRIAPRSRAIHADNRALSLARAKSVGRYLAAALHLPPAALQLNGSGEKEPLVANSTAANRALNRRVEVRISALQRIETTQLKIIKGRSGVEKLATTGGLQQESTKELPPLTPLQPTDAAVVVQPAANAAEAALAAAVAHAAKDDTPPGTSASATNQGQLKKTAPLPATVGEHVELVAALSEGIVHYRIRLQGVREPLKKVTATLLTPKSTLYMTGTSTLSGSAVVDPDTREAMLTYNFATLAQEKKFDLHLQALIDGDEQTEALASSVTVVIAAADGTPLKTLFATTELSDNMEEINRPDTPLAAENPAAASGKEQDAAENLSEFVEKIVQKDAAGKTAAPAPDQGLHVQDKEGILSPADGIALATRINAVRIVLGSKLTPLLTLDNVEIPAERIGFSMKDRGSEKTLYTYIGVDFGEAGDHVLRLQGLDSFGVARFDSSARLTRTGEIIAIRLVTADDNVADGRTPVKVRVQLLDKDNKPVLANAELAITAGDLRPVTASNNIGRIVGSSTVSVASDGWIKFQPVTASGLYRLQLAYNKATIDIETYVKPKMRDWILVGLAEGTIGYRTASGNMESLQASGDAEHLYDEERLAFYAKGTIKGEWLLTMAYDSANQKTGVATNALFQTIDPNSYYTLYGDATSQAYDAASQRRLYLKIERDQFYALFGDYNTGLTVTELSRYSRRLSGIKAEFRSRDHELTVFGSETGQSFVKDEIPGDGTSGLYRLSRKSLVSNSEKIVIETRDRFHSEVITATRQMTRFIDYSIDYDAGTIFFKSAIASKDELLNPVYIVVDYEVSDGGKDALTFGGRAATKLLDGNLKLGGTYLHEGHVSSDSNLYGADAALQLGQETKARAEFATTNSDTGSEKKHGNAYLAEISHGSKTLDGKLYYREQEAGFGLGQQQATETATRKLGVESAYKLNDRFTLSGQAYRQYSLASGSVRDFIESQASYTEKQFTTRAGLRYAIDTQADNSSATSLLATLGGSWKTLNQQLTLRADHEQALFAKNNNTSFPTKTVLGADFQATKAIMLYAQEELTYGETANTNTSRVGVKATPWSGGTISSAVVNDLKENSDRTFANVGLAQKWQLTPFWTVDGGLDHSETIRKKSVTLATATTTTTATTGSVSTSEDFTAVSLGANYQGKKLSWANRVEYRNSDSEDKWGVLSSLVNEQGVNWGWTSKLQLLHTQASGSSKTDADLRLGLAYRPPVTRWIILDRLDLITADEQSSTDSTRSKRIVNNLNVNYRPDNSSQLSLQYGAKYVLEKLSATEYNGFIDLIAIEGRFDLSKTWDIGLRSAMLHTWSSSQLSYSVGPSIGCNIMENAWLSLGYNLLGFHDKDFSSSNYTAQGPFVQFRFKFDQNSLKDGLKALNQ